MSVFTKETNLDLSGVPTLPYWRPDSIAILSDSDAIYRFNRYWRILARKTLAKFKILRKIAVEPYNKKTDIDTLWSIHDNYITYYRELIREKDDNELLDWYNKTETPSMNLLRLKADIADRMTEKCEFCEFRCKVNRKANILGVCSVPYQSRIASMFVHIGEEPELVPSYTIFFSGCNFKCVYCQNWDISQRQTGHYLEPSIVATSIDEHYSEGKIRNVNWVGGEPTPNIHYILQVLLYLESNVPQIWNSNLYLSIKGMKLLEGVIDLWLPDFKYGNNKCALKYSKIPNYFDVVTRNLRILSENVEEILIRHLVLPNHVECCSFRVLNWIRDNLNLDYVRVNIMAQYRPEYRAYDFPELARRITSDEFSRVVSYARQLGIPLSK